jgi:hypothetical protein
MPGIGGLEAARVIRRESPRLSADARIPPGSKAARFAQVGRSPRLEGMASLAADTS